MCIQYTTGFKGGLTRRPCSLPLSQFQTFTIVPNRSFNEHCAYVVYNNNILKIRVLLRFTRYFSETAVY